MISSYIAEGFYLWPKKNHDIYYTMDLKTRNGWVHGTVCVDRPRNGFYCLRDEKKREFARFKCLVFPRQKTA